MSTKKEKKIFDLKKMKEFLIAINKFSFQKTEVIKTSLTHHSIQMTMCYINKSVDDKCNGDVLI